MTLILKFKIKNVKSQIFSSSFLRFFHPTFQHLNIIIKGLVFLVFLLLFPAKIETLISLNLWGFHFRASWILQQPEKRCLHRRTLPES